MILVFLWTSYLKYGDISAKNLQKFTWKMRKLQGAGIQDGGKTRRGIQRKCIHIYKHEWRNGKKFLEKTEE